MDQSPSLCRDGIRALVHNAMWLDLPMSMLSVENMSQNTF